MHRKQVLNAKRRKAPSDGTLTEIPITMSSELPRNLNNNSTSNLELLSQLKDKQASTCRGRGRPRKVSTTIVPQGLTDANSQIHFTSVTRKRSSRSNGPENIADTENESVEYNVGMLKEIPITISSRRRKLNNSSRSRVDIQPQVKDTQASSSKESVYGNCLTRINRFKLTNRCILHQSRETEVLENITETENESVAYNVGTLKEIPITISSRRRKLNNSSSSRVDLQPQVKDTQASSSRVRGRPRKVSTEIVRQGLTDANSQIEFQMDVMVVDKTGSATLSMPNSPCVNLIGECASEIKEIYGDSTGSIPNVIEDALINKKALFEVRISSDRSIAQGDHHTVARIALDEELMYIYEEIYGKRETPTNDHATHGTLGDRKREKEKQQQTDDGENEAVHGRADAENIEGENTDVDAENIEENNTDAASEVGTDVTHNLMRRRIMLKKEK
ncbi:hypothetical protein CASFOL_042515 [Castilleja foliolosa]|uniref:Uncharacterized protein n=1 Tax=Castilleja foliolosa TaxID=1961234 RepID=A0ABD3BBG5_9LAMI